MPPHRVDGVAGGPSQRGLTGAVQAVGAEREQISHVARQADGGVAEVDDLVVDNEIVKSPKAYGA